MADGKITIDTKLDNAGFKAGSKELLSAIKSLERTAASMGKNMQGSAAGYGSAMRNSIRAAREFNDELRQLERNASQMRKELDYRGTQNGAKRFLEITESIKKYERSMYNAQKQADALYDRLGDRAFNDRAYQKADEAVTRYAEKIRTLKAERDSLGVKEADILDFRNQEQTVEHMEKRLREMREVSDEVGGGFRILMRNAGGAVASIARIAGVGAVAFLKKLASGARNAAIQLARLAGRAASNGLKKIGQLAEGATKKLLGLGRSARQNGNGFQLSLKNLLKYGLGIRSMFVLFNRLRNAIKEGFTTLASSDSRVNASLKSLSAALNGLKGSLAGAFSPILTAVAPALTTLINMLTSAVNAIGMFMAAITGQAYYNAAKGIGSIGTSASKSSGSVKELKRQLASFDELNILTDTSGGGGGGGGSSAGYSFEKTPIAAGIQNFVDEIKKLVAQGDWDGLGGLFADKINGVFERAKKLVSWDNLGNKIQKAVDAISGTFNGLIKKIKWEDIGDTFANGVNTIIKTGNEILTKFDFPAMAAGLTRGLNQFIKHIEWRELGDLIARRAQTVVDSLIAAITTFKWGDAGTKFAEALNGFFSNEKLWRGAGYAINMAIRGLLDFTKNFAIKFDPIQAAKDIKAALGQIQWGTIATEFWDTAKAAFGNFSEFIKELLKTDNPAEKYFREKPAGVKNSSNSFGTMFSELSITILNAIKKAFGDIPWTDWGDRIHKFLLDIEWGDIADALWDAVVAAASGVGKLIVSALFGSDNALFKWLFPDNKQTLTGTSGAKTETRTSSGSGAVKLLGLGAGLKVGSSVIDNAVKALFGTGGGNGGLVVGKGLLSSALPILGALGATGYAGYKVGSGPVGKKIGDTFVQPLLEMAYEAVKPGIENATEVLKSGEKINTGLGAFADLVTFFQPKEVRDSLNNGIGALIKIGSDFAKNGGDERGWQRLYEGIELTTGYELPSPYELEKTGYYNGGFFPNTIDLDPHYWEDNTNALKDNTKAEKKQTKAIAPSAVKPTHQIFQSPKIDAGVTWDTSGWQDAFDGVQPNVTASIDFLPKGSGGAGFLNKPLEWLTKVFAPGTDTKTRVELVKKIPGQTPDILFNTAKLLSVFAQLFQKPGTNGIAGIFGTALNVLATLFQKPGTKGVNATYGNDLNVFSTLARLAGSLTVPGVYGTGLGVFSTLARLAGTFTVPGLYGTGLGVESTLKQAPNTDGTEDIYKTKITVEATIKKAPGNKLTYTMGYNAANTSQIVIAGSGGIITNSGKLRRFASGGWLSGSLSGLWNGVNKYASGTTRAHGTLFAAGEAGPEIVGHVNGRTEVLNQSQLAATMKSAVSSGMISALRGITFRMPAMATGSVMPYDVSAQIARSTADLQNTLDTNNEDLIQTIISVAGQIVAAIQAQERRSGSGAGSMSAQQVINEINRRTQMFSASPLKGV